MKKKTIKKEMEKTINELIETYEEYINLLDADAQPARSLAFAHGFTSKPDDIKRGQELRDKIVLLKDVLKLKSSPLNSQ